MFVWLVWMFCVGGFICFECLVVCYFVLACLCVALFVSLRLIILLLWLCFLFVLFITRVCFWLVLTICVTLILGRFRSFVVKGNYFDLFGCFITLIFYLFMLSVCFYVWLDCISQWFVVVWCTGLLCRLLWLVFCFDCMMMVVGLIVLDLGDFDILTVCLCFSCYDCCLDYFVEGYLLVCLVVWCFEFFGFTVI